MQSLNKQEPKYAGYQAKFRDDLVKILATGVDSLGTKDKKTFNSNFLSHLIGEPEKEIERRLFEDQRELAEVIRSFLEILKVDQRLESDLHAFRNRMSRSKNSSPSEHMRGLISSHLSSIYILRARIKQFCNQMQKISKQDAKHIKKITSEILGLYDVQFKFELKWRNLLTHHFEYDDKELNQLSSQELFIKMNLLGEELTAGLKIFYAQTMRKYRSRWSKRVIKNKTAVTTVLDLMCFLLHGYLRQPR